MTDDPLRWSKADIKLDKELELGFRQVKDLKRAFDYFDEKGAGVITPNYLKIAFRALGFEPTPKEMKMLINEVETEMGGFLSFHDFLELMSKKMTDQEDEMRIIQAFRLLNCGDSDGITFDDLKNIAEELEVEINDEEVQEMIEEGDVRVKGRVTLPDFKYIMHRFYRMQSKDAKWCFKYPRNFNYFQVCGRKSRSYSEIEEGEGEGEEGDLEDSVGSPRATSTTSAAMAFFQPKSSASAVRKSGTEDSKIPRSSQKKIEELEIEDV